MARIIDYEQDEDKPFGVGTHHLDDGTSYYLDDPERARSVLEELYGQSDPRAQIGRESTDIALGQGLSQPAAYRGAVAGPGGGESLESRDDSANMSVAPNQSVERDDDEDEPERQAGDPPPLTEQQLEREATAQRGAAILGSVPTKRRVAGVDPEKMQREGKPVDQHFMRKGALPEQVYETQRDARQKSLDEGNQLLTSIYNEKISAQQANAERLRREALLMKVKNDADELAVQRKQEKYRTDRAALEQEVDAYYDKSKPEPDGGLRKARGPVGNIASAIAQFMGAYAAIISGSPNFANQILNRKVDQHVDAQMEEFKRGKMKRDGQLQRMAERGMSVEQMKTALKLQQERYIQKELELRAAVEGTRESKAAKESILLERRERALALEQQFQRESLGETSVSGDIVQPKAGGLVPLTEDERIELATKRAKAGNEFGYELGGGKHAEDAQERQDKRDDRQGQRQSDLNKSVTTFADKQAKEVSELDQVDAAASAIRKLDKKHGGLPGVGTFDLSGSLPNATELGKDARALKQHVQTLLNAIIKASPGASSDSDEGRIRAQIEGADTEEGLRQGIAAFERWSTSKRASIEASADPETRAEFQKRKDQALIERRKKERDQKNRGEVY